VRRRQTPLPEGVSAHKLRHTFASILYVRGEDPPYVMAQFGHTDAGFTLRVYAHAMRRDEGDKERLKALVEGRDWAPLGTTPGQTPLADPSAEAPENDETPADAGASEDGRGGFRTCDLSRVKRHGTLGREGRFSLYCAGFAADRARELGAGMCPDERGWRGIQAHLGARRDLSRPICT
jgi:hypothetical protein